jgi:hypothetical protein
MCSTTLQFYGALFTSDTAGTVDRNIYDTKDQVWLSGGPDKRGNPLPTDTYYDQVIDPKNSDCCRQ